MIDSLLIANRGEIARRIIRTCRKLGVRTVAVYSDADAHAPHVREADAAVRLGPAPARESYLKMDAVLEAARRTGASAVHPGYGFLSENAAFAEAVIAAGLTWVGPPPAAIRAMGLKDAAKRLMAEAGVPVTPGYLGEDQSPERLAREAAAIGYPVLIKAVAGGGGKGMRRVDEAAAFADALAGAQREAASSFGDERVLIEKYVSRPRHIEVQVFADSHGQTVHLFERDCSLQRRHQKVIEEAPAPGMDAATRAAVAAAAIKAAQAVAYEGAGTVEFIADASEGLRADRIWFMEMNTRLQVEHPVTERITGLDLVEWQLRVASGEPLPLRQDDIAIDGWAMEARLYAEDPARGFLPSTGRLEVFGVPEGGARVDSAVEEGGEVTPFYDPMIAKVIVHAPDRASAAAKLAQACAEVRVWPVRTNAGFLVRCLREPAFVAGEVDTGFIPARQDALTAPPGLSQARLSALAAAVSAPPPFRESGPLNAPELTGFRANGRPAREVALWVDGQLRLAEAQGGEPARAPAGPPPWRVFEGGEVYEVALDPPVAAGLAGGASNGQLTAPMPGRIVSVAVKAGDAVRKGQAVVALEAMKMEHALSAPFDGVAAEVPVAVGQQVSEGALLARIAPAAAQA